MNTKFAKLIAIAVDTEEKAVKVKQLPSGVWRKFCPICRGEFLPNESTCQKCVETTAAHANAFRKTVNKALKEQEGKGDSEPKKTRAQIENEILGSIRYEALSARTHGRHSEAWKLERTHKILKSDKLKRLIDLHVKSLQEGVEDPHERDRIQKKVYEGLAPEMKEQLHIAMSRLPEAVEVFPAKARLLKDLIERLRKRGKEVTSTFVAAKALKLTDREAFVTLALENGIKPIESIDPTGTVQISEQLSRKVREEGTMAQTELHGFKSPFHYAAWNVADIKRLKRILKNKTERADLETQVKTLKEGVGQLYRQRADLRNDLKELEDMAAKSPERMTETFIRRNKIQEDLHKVETQLQERHTEMQNMQALLQERGSIKF